MPLQTSSNTSISLNSLNLSKFFSQIFLKVYQVSLLRVYIFGWILFIQPLIQVVAGLYICWAVMFLKAFWNFIGQIFACYICESLIKSLIKLFFSDYLLSHFVGKRLGSSAFTKLKKTVMQKKKFSKISIFLLQFQNQIFTIRSIKKW